MMRSLLPILLLILFGFAVATGCIDPFSPDLEESPDTLVVDGLVTNGPGPHRIQLSRSGVFEQSVRGIDRPVPGADVIIQDDAGNEVLLTENRPDIDPGVYVTAEGALVGTVGRTYTLRVSLPDGSTYTSSPQRMRPVPSLDTLIVQETDQPEGGLEVLAGFRESEETGQFYRWAINSVAAFGILVIGRCQFPDQKGDVCFFRDSRTPGVVNVTDDQLINGQSVLRPVRRFQPESDALRLPHAVRVQQQSLTPDAYEFWNAIREQIENSGTTFSSPPARIEGNVRNPSDPTDVALGFFQVSAVSEATRCVDPTDFDSYDRNPKIPCSTCQGVLVEATPNEPEERAQVCPPLGRPGGPTAPPSL
jgi:hypothetical protein